MVRVHEALIESSVGSMQRAASGSDLVLEETRLRPLPAWLSSMLALVRDDARGDRETVRREIEAIRSKIQHHELPAVAVEYHLSGTVPMLLRTGYNDAAVDLMTDATNADSPPPYDMLRTNPLFRQVNGDARVRDIVIRSRAKFDVLLRAVDEA